MPGSPVIRLGALGARVFYRLEIAGATPPADGPLLVVANHPNSLLDPALVTVATGRPARFLAKAPLFTDPKVGALVRASGAIPVHRRQDGAAPPGSNDDTFRAAEEALAGGDAIALFPEGISHARPGLAPLKTGAARLALGTAARLGRAFPLVPVGITLDDRAIFRSNGLLVVGEPLAWDDLAEAAVAAARAGGDATDPPLVRALTARIDDALRGVTVSHASWEDAHLVALADDVHAAAEQAAALALPGATPPGAARAAVATDAPPSTPARDPLARQRLGAALLDRARAGESAEAAAARDAVASLGGDLRSHARLLRALHLQPADLAVPTDVGTALGWALRRVHLVLLGALAAVGTVLGWVPYTLTGRVATRFPGAEASDVRATSKALVGAASFVVWTLLLAIVAGVAFGWWAALLALVVVPPLLLLALFTGEGWTSAWADARRFLTLHARAGRVAELRARQAALAARIADVVARLEALPASPAGVDAGARGAPAASRAADVASR